jgi:AbrB family looped-hinge helix DNA binding protein
MSDSDTLTTTLSTKCQVILPKEIRDGLHWTPGTRLIVEKTPQGVLLKQAPIFPPTTLDQVFGCLKQEGPALTLEDMDNAIGEAVMEHLARSRY